MYVHRLILNYFLPLLNGLQGKVLEPTISVTIVMTIFSLEVEGHRSCRFILNCFTKLYSNWGIPQAPKKMVGPTTNYLFRPWNRFSSIDHLSPTNKLAPIKETINAALSLGKNSIRALESLIESLSFVLACVNVTSTDLYFCWVNLFILFMFSDISKPVLSIIFQKLTQMILYFCCVWIRLINLHLPLLRKCDKSKHLLWIWCSSNALVPAVLRHWMHQNSVCVHWICLISLVKVNAHLLTSNWYPHKEVF